MTTAWFTCCLNKPFPVPLLVFSARVASPTRATIKQPHPNTASHRSHLFEFITSALCSMHSILSIQTVHTIQSFIDTDIKPRCTDFSSNFAVELVRFFKLGLQLETLLAETATQIVRERHSFSCGFEQLLRAVYYRLISL